MRILSRRRYATKRKDIVHEILEIERKDDARATQANLTLFTPDEKEHWTLIRTMVTQCEWRPTPHATDATEAGWAVAVYPIGDENLDEATYPDLSEALPEVQANGTASRELEDPKSFVWFDRQYFWLHGIDDTGSHPYESYNMLRNSGVFDNRAMRKIPESGALMFSWYWNDSGSKISASKMMMTIHIWLKRTD